MPASQLLKLTMLMLLALLLLSYGVGNIRCSTVSENSTDVLSLLDFKKAITNDPGVVLSKYWNNSTPYCQWKGVTCSPKHPGRVTALSLAGQGFSGPIAASLGNLTFLRTLDLSNNHFSGQIPPLNNLHKLQGLNLSTNSLEGNIPDALINCSDLLSLDLSKNTLVGTIPPKIGLLHNLTTLALRSNNLTGIIPPTLNNITQLEEMRLANNNLEGTIPREFGQMSKLLWLSLSENNLSGGIPHDFFKNMSSLQTLSLQTNILGGTLPPPNIGNALPNLIRLSLADNMFEGHIPDSLGNASLLARIEPSENNFIGQVPSSFGQLSGLSTLNLEINKLEARDNQGWEFLYALRNCSYLEVLSLAKNQLFGVVPNSIGNLSISLQELLLGRNNLSGIVPPSIGNLQGLISLGLEHNGFSGTLEWIGNLKNLQVLEIDNNNFIGSIPTSISNLPQLTHLYLQNNKLEGPIYTTQLGKPFSSLNVEP